MAGSPSKRTGGKSVGKPKSGSAAKSSPSVTVFLIIKDTAEKAQLESALVGFGFTVHSYLTAREFLLHKMDLTGCVVISDFRLMGMTGAELWQLIQKEHPFVPVVFVTGHADSPSVVREAPTDFLIRAVDPEKLRSAVIRAIDGEEFDLTNLDRGFDPLTDREFEVLELVISGVSSREIAARLGVATKTVEAHRARIMDKTRADDMPHLMRLWRAWRAGTSDPHNAGSN